MVALSIIILSPSSRRRPRRPHLPPHYYYYSLLDVNMNTSSRNFLFPSFLSGPNYPAATTVHDAINPPALPPIFSTSLLQLFTALLSPALPKREGGMEGGSAILVD